MRCRRTTRKKALATIKDLYGVKHTDAIALLESDDCEELCDLLHTYSDVNTYQEAVAVLEARRNDGGPTKCQRRPRNR